MIHQNFAEKVTSRHRTESFAYMGNFLMPHLKDLADDLARMRFGFLLMVVMGLASCVGNSHLNRGSIFLYSSEYKSGDVTNKSISDLFISIQDGVLVEVRHPFGFFEHVVYIDTANGQLESKTRNLPPNSELPYYFEKTGKSITKHVGMAPYVIDVPFIISKNDLMTSVPNLGQCRLALGENYSTEFIKKDTSIKCNSYTYKCFILKERISPPLPLPIFERITFLEKRTLIPVLIQESILRNDKYYDYRASNEITRYQISGIIFASDSVSKYYIVTNCSVK